MRMIKSDEQELLAEIRQAAAPPRQHALREAGIEVRRRDERREHRHDEAKEAHHERAAVGIRAAVDDLLVERLDLCRVKIGVVGRGQLHVPRGTCIGCRLVVRGLLVHHLGEERRGGEPDETRRSHHHGKQSREAHPQHLAVHQPVQIGFQQVKHDAHRLP